MQYCSPNNDCVECLTSEHCEGVCTPFFTCAACNDNTQCDDGLLCNGRETCLNGLCIAGIPPACGVNFCSERLQQCVDCLDDIHCDVGFCGNQGVCVECVVDDHCLEEAICEDGECRRRSSTASTGLVVAVSVLSVLVLGVVFGLFSWRFGGHVSQQRKLSTLYKLGSLRGMGRTSQTSEQL